MPYKEREKRLVLQQSWYARNKDKHLAQMRKRRQELASYVREIKLKSKCERCGESHPACLQFHHRDPEEKDLHIKEAVRNGWSLERLKKEIEKCDILCANCHFKEHWKENDLEIDAAMM